MNLTTYSAAFREEAVRKTLRRGTRTVADMAGELNISVHTLKNWLRSPQMAHLRESATGERRAGQWGAAERLQALLETRDFSGEELNAWCRQRGLFAHQLAEWRKTLEAPATPAADAAQVRGLKEENAALRRDLARKDRALSEAAALLVLQKKYQALWEDEDK